MVAGKHVVVSLVPYPPIALRDAQYSHAQPVLKSCTRRRMQYWKCSTEIGFAGTRMRGALPRPLSCSRYPFGMAESIAISCVPVQVVPKSRR
eukprot:1620207-Rhodomonas_salina.1